MMKGKRDLEGYKTVQNILNAYEYHNYKNSVFLEFRF